MSGDKMSLEEYVKELLKSGKKRDHEDFQILYNVFGKDRIMTIARAILLGKNTPKKDVDPGHD